MFNKFNFFVCTDECTHLDNFSKPVDPELAFIVSASRDGYIPRTGLIPLTTLWPGSTMRVLDCGHVLAIVWHSNAFRKAIVDSLDLNARKYYGSSLLNCSSDETSKIESKPFHMQQKVFQQRLEVK